jgi:hypothetical protein
MSVIVRGLDAWNPERQDAIEEPRLLDAVRRVLGPQVRALRHAPWDPAEKDDPYTRVGVPVTPFPVDALAALLPPWLSRLAWAVRAGPPIRHPAATGVSSVTGLRARAKLPCYAPLATSSWPDSIARITAVWRAC